MSSFRSAYSSVFFMMPVMGIAGSFQPAYDIVKVNEGGYAFIAADKGGETYAGIARNYNPDWKGWVYIDYIKRTKGPIKNNTKFPDIQYLVEEFYESRFTSNGLKQINSQKITNLLFDYQVHSGSIAIKAIQRLVGVSADGVLGSQSIAAINRANEDSLYVALLNERKAFLDKLVNSTAGYEQFRAGFAKRLAQFEQFITTPGGVGTVVIALVALGTMTALLIAANDKKKKRNSTSLKAAA